MPTSKLPAIIKPALIHLPAVLKELALASTFPEIKRISDLSEAAHAYARAAHLGAEAEMNASEIKVRAQRKGGEMLQTMNKQHGARDGKKTGLQATTPLSDIGVTKDESHRWQAVAAVPEGEFEKLLESGREKGRISTESFVRVQKEKKRAAHRKDNAEKVQNITAPEQLTNVFSTIVIDPPWDWGDEGDADQLGRARPEYATVPYEQLLKLPIENLADKDCHLYLWITNRSLPKGFGLLDAWGFRYITTLTWCKPSFGMGNYFRGQTEHMLFGVRGSMPLKRKNAGTWYEWPRGPKGHSSKPTQSYELIESCSHGPYLQMYPGEDRKDWTSWGLPL